MSYGNINIVPKWIKVTKSYTDFSTGGLTNTIDVITLPAGWVIHANIIKPTQSFTGGIISAYTVSLGIEGNLVKYGAAFNVLQAPGATVQQLTSSLFVENWDAGVAIKATAISVTANLDAATQGSVDIYMLISQAKQ